MSIDVAHLSFSYGNREILHDLSFSIPDGCLVNVLGPNGVGKSTLFRCILGLSPHYSGTILVNGKDLRALSVRERAREISYIPQSHAPVYDYEVVDVVLMATGNDLKMLATPGEAQLQRAHEALARIGIEHLAHRTYTQISGGEQQLVLIARALAQNAQTIIMDEPTSALDYGNTMRVLSCVRQLAREGLSIVQSTHNPDHAFLYSDATFEGAAAGLRQPPRGHHLRAHQRAVRHRGGGQFPLWRQGARLRARARDRTFLTWEERKTAC